MARYKHIEDEPPPFLMKALQGVGAIVFYILLYYLLNL
jgi:hypothetical protein